MIQETFSLANIAHPRKDIAPLAVGLAWGNDGAIYQEKLDGVFTLWPESGKRKAESGNNLLAGEGVRGEFIAWDVLAYGGEDVRALPLSARLWMRDEICRIHHLRGVTSYPDGGELLQAVLARGGEGVVRKLPGATYFDTMTACKRIQTWQCVVTALFPATGGARIMDAVTGEARGTVPLRNRASACRVGSIIKVEGETLSAGGMILKPRPCKDTPTSWLITF